MGLNAVILGLTLAANDGAAFTSPNWHATPAVCPIRATLIFQGEPGAVVHVQWTSQIEGVQPFSDGSGWVGQPWVDVSGPITLDGTVQTFSTGDFGNGGFYRLRL